MTVGTHAQRAAGQPSEAGLHRDFSQVFVEHAPFVWRMLRRLGVSESDVEDVCQEVFLIVHQKALEFDGTSTLKTWIGGICVRKAMNHVKARRASDARLSQTAHEPAFDPPQERVLDARADLALLDRLLDRLDDGARAVFVLYQIEGLSMSEVSTIVGCPLQTAYSRLHSAREAVSAGLRRARRTP